MFSRKEVFLGVFWIFLPTGKPDWAKSFHIGLVPFSPTFEQFYLYVVLINIWGPGFCWQYSHSTFYIETLLQHREMYLSARGRDQVSAICGMRCTIRRIFQHGILTSICIGPHRIRMICVKRSTVLFISSWLLALAQPSIAQHKNSVSTPSSPPFPLH